MFLYRGSLIGHPVENIRIVLTDGVSHAVDSSELAFKLAAIYAFRQVFLSFNMYLLFYSVFWSSFLLVSAYSFFFSPLGVAIIKLLMLFTDLLFTVPFKQCYVSAKPVILEPIMLVELKAPTEFQGTVTGDINKFVFCYFFSFVIGSCFLVLGGPLTLNMHLI